MTTVEIRDDAIWISHIEGSNMLRQRLQALNAGDVIDLEVDGVAGSATPLLYTPPSDLPPVLGVFWLRE